MNVQMLFSIETSQPFQGSCGVINSYFKRALCDLGFRVRAFHRNHRQQLPHSERLIPLEDVARIRTILSSGSPSISFYDDFGLGIRAPEIRPQHKNVLFLHGLQGFPGTAIGNPAIDLYCCNSRYMESVLRSFLLFPDWERRTTIADGTRAALTSIRLPVPLLEHSNGYPGKGTDLPSSVKEALSDGCVVGHSVQRDKPCPNALAHIMWHLNRTAVENEGPAFRLVVSNDIMPELTVTLEANAEHWPSNAAEWFIPVPVLNNAALVKLMRKCSFGLCYNRIPDSFGLYPLESVHLGCPVFTNGVGNNRWLLPTDHGITVFETEDMAFGGTDDFQVVAEIVYEEIQSNRAAAACSRGAQYIAAQHSLDAFTEDLGNAITQLERDSLSATFESMVIAISPLVRQWNPLSCRVVSDYRNVILSDRDASVIQTTLGLSVGQVLSRNNANRNVEAIQHLLDIGVLSLIETAV